MIFNLRKGFFLDRGHDNFMSRRPRRIKHEERKLAVAGDETDTLHNFGKEDVASCVSTTTSFNHAALR